MNVVSFSAWLEYFGDGENTQEFAPVIEAPETLIVPTLTLYEVSKRIVVIADEGTALDAIAVMLQGTAVDLTPVLAIDAARLSREAGLAMADSIILATARSFDATLWTEEARFEGMNSVELRAKAVSGSQAPQPGSFRRRRASRRKLVMRRLCAPTLDAHVF